VRTCVLVYVCIDVCVGVRERVCMRTSAGVCVFVRARRVHRPCPSRTLVCVRGRCREFCACVRVFIGKRRVWKGGFPHLVTKAEIMGGGVKFK